VVAKVGHDAGLSDGEVMRREDLRGSVEGFIYVSWKELGNEAPGV
jgi:hypothetical protein